MDDAKYFDDGFPRTIRDYIGAITNSQDPATRPLRPICGFRANAAIPFSKVSITDSATVSLSSDINECSASRSRKDVGAQRTVIARSLLLTQSRDGAVYFRLSGELPGIGLAKSLTNMINLPLMNIDICFERLVHDVGTVAIERRSNSIQGLADLRLDADRHGFASH